MAKFSKIAVPAARSSAPVLAIRRRLVLGLLAAAIAASVLAVVIASNSTTVVSAPPGAASPTVAFATEIGRDYLNGRPTDAPVATNVDPTFGYEPDRSEPFQWSQMTLSSVRPSVYGENGQRIYEVVYFVQINQPDPEGEGLLPVTYQLTVPMLVPGTTYPRLAATPTLLPLVLDNSRLSALRPSEIAGAGGPNDVNDQVTKVIRDWAVAFAQGGENDPVLKRVTGDPSDASQYSGMGGWTLDGVSIAGQVPAPGDGDTGFVVRVTLALTPPAGTGPTTEATYDVWVAQTSPGQANPPVVAWGPPGTAERMTPYQNAVTPS